MNLIPKIEKERLLLTLEDGTVAGKVNFPAVSCSLSNIEQVYVAPEFRGQGLASQLMELTIEHLQNQGRRVILTCSYAQQWMKERPELRFMLASDIYFEKK